MAGTSTIKVRVGRGDLVVVCARVRGEVQELPGVGVLAFSCYGKKHCKVVCLMIYTPCILYISQHASEFNESDEDKSLTLFLLTFKDLTCVTFLHVVFAILSHCLNRYAARK